MTSSYDWLFGGTQFIKGIGPRRASELIELGVADVYDLFHVLPKAYRDLRQVVPLAQAVEGVEAAFKVTVVQRPTKAGRRRFWRASVADDTATAELFWFTHKLPGPAQDLEPGRQVWIVGKPSRRNLLISFAHPRLTGERGPGAVEPIYRGAPWLGPAMRRAVAAAREDLDRADPLPATWRRTWDLLSWGEAFTQIHDPAATQDEAVIGESLRFSSPGYRRAAADMFLGFFLGMELRRRRLRAAVAPQVVVDPDKLAKVRAALPFTLTRDQELVLNAVLADMAKPTPMFRLVQGDVGSGKTVVALMAAAAVAQTGGQAALLVPTEILAGQHARFFDRVLAGLGLRIGLLVGSLSPARKQEVHWQIAHGGVDIVIGTHALLSEGVAFKDLRLVAIDEEQRYGVGQRAALRAKGEAPHTLLLSATPIPRSLALALLGETDTSIVRSRPAGRAGITTRIVAPQEKRMVLEHIERELAAGHKVFFLYPRVDVEGEEGKRSVLEMHQRLADYFGADKVGLLHGRLKGSAKDRALRDLVEGRTQILVSTSVIEVGVDVPDATILVIGHPEVFGLSQLHQIRGRIGRGTLPGTCYLLTEEGIDAESLARLEVLTRTSDGFEIAEEDLKLRGPGTLLGTRQSGVPDVDPVLLNRFRDLAAAVKHGAQQILDADPELTAPEHAGLAQVLKRKWGVDPGDADRSSSTNMA